MNRAFLIYWSLFLFSGAIFFGALSFIALEPAVKTWMVGFALILFILSISVFVSAFKSKQ